MNTIKTKNSESTRLVVDLESTPRIDINATSGLPARVSSEMLKIENMKRIYSPSYMKVKYVFNNVAVIKAEMDTFLHQAIVDYQLPTKSYKLPIADL
jgi:hypothetical protein